MTWLSHMTSRSLRGFICKTETLIWTLGALWIKWENRYKIFVPTQKTACDGQYCHHLLPLKYKKSYNILSFDVIPFSIGMHVIYRKMIYTYLGINTYICLHYIQIYMSVNLHDKYEHIHRCTHISTHMHTLWPRCSFILSSSTWTLASFSFLNPKYEQYWQQVSWRSCFFLCWLLLSFLYVLIYFLPIAYYLPLLHTHFPYREMVDRR